MQKYELNPNKGWNAKSPFLFPSLSTPYYKLPGPPQKNAIKIYCHTPLLEHLSILDAQVNQYIVHTSTPPPPSPYIITIEERENLATIDTVL